MDAVHGQIESVDHVIDSVKEQVAQTGFELTDAVCPIGGFVPTVGFRYSTYFDEYCGRMKILAVSQTKGKLLESFVAIVEKILKFGRIRRGQMNAVFESRHNPMDQTPGKKYDCIERPKYYRDFVTDSIDPVSFLSRIWDWENLFVNDGFSGVSVMSKSAMSEVRIEVHKMILLLTPETIILKKVARFLRDSGMPKLAQDAPDIAEEPHLHIGHSDYKEEFNRIIANEGAELLVR